ncbi:MAG: DUF1611 domain-containing protein [Acidobacteriota bacterium]
MEAQSAVVLTQGLLATNFAKTAHGLLRGSDRFAVRAVIDERHGGRDAGEVMDGRAKGVPVFATLADCLATVGEPPPRWMVVGVAFPGGYLPAPAREQVRQALEAGLSVVSGLHQWLADDDELMALAAAHGGELLDIRRPRPDLHFWSGAVLDLPARRLAVLGMDCAIGKRTTCRWLWQGCRRRGLAAEMIYTGQTGWMQGYRHGFLFDATPNDFVSGELERALLDCHRDTGAELILIEGQSGLRNPSGPCGSEMLLSGAVDGVVLQVAPGREFFVDFEDRGCRLPSIASEIELIRVYGVETWAVCLNGEGLSGRQLAEAQAELRAELGLPVIRPLDEGIDELVEVVAHRLRA